MPTPKGKPKVGETLYDRHGVPIGKILERTNGNYYSVRVLRTGQKYPTLITEYEYWAEKHGWSTK